MLVLHPYRPCQLQEQQRLHRALKSRGGGTRTGVSMGGSLNKNMKIKPREQRVGEAQTHAHPT